MANHYFPVHFPQGPAKKARPAKAENHYLHYQLNDLNAENNPNPAVT